MKILIANSKGGCGKSTLALALAKYLSADIVDLDEQGTLRVAASFSGEYVPVDECKATKKVVIYDTPPYNSSEFLMLCREAELILIPSKVKYPDLLALKGMVDIVRLAEAQEKAWIVFNEVRKPHSKTYREIKEIFSKNYKDIRRAKTELSNLVGFTKVFTEDLKGQALEEIKKLVKELKV